MSRPKIYIKKTRLDYFFDDCTGISYLHFYMNWGWNDSLFNGNFAYNNFNPSSATYNDNKRMVYNIIP